MKAPRIDHHALALLALLSSSALGCAAKEALPMAAQSPGYAKSAPIRDGSPEPPADAAYAGGSGMAPAAAAPGMTPHPAASPGAKTTASKGKEVDAEQEKSGDAGMEQMLVFTGQLQLAVDGQKFSQTIDAVVDIATALGGYIAKQDDRTVTVRVPSKRFRDAMREVGKLGDLMHRAVQAEDVTEQYHDLAVRLKSLRATRERLQDFLKQAKNIQEVLQVEQQLSRLNAEIDGIEGRMRFLATRAAFSTITVALQPKPKKQVIVDPVNPPPPPPRTIPLPIKWLTSVGLDRLLQLK